MAQVDYFAIAEEIAEIIRAANPSMLVAVEEEVLVGPDNSPAVCVFIDRREVPSSQPIAAGLKMRVIIHFSIWVWTYCLSVPDAIRERDVLIGKIELLLMQNRTIHEMVDMLWIDGGDLPTARLPDSSGFTSGGEILVRAEVMAEV